MFQIKATENTETFMY